MNRATIIIVIIFLLLLIGIIIAFSYFTGDQEQIGPSPERGFFETIFPFVGTGGTRPVVDETPEDERDIPLQSPSTLQQITQRPVAGLVLIEKDVNGGVAELIRYVERDTGHFFEVSMRGDQRNRISNTTLPQVQRAIWSPNGERVVLQFVNENAIIESFSAEVPENPNDSLDGSSLEEGAQYVSVFDNEIGYNVVNETGTSFIRTNHEGGARREVLFSPLRELSIHWSRPTQIVYTTKPSAFSVGIGFFVNTSNNTSQPIQEISALSVLPHPNNTQVLTSGVINRLFPYLSIEDLRTARIGVTDLRTFAEKCVWNIAQENSVYCAVPTQFSIKVTSPDDWYKGFVQFSDEIWELNTDTLNTQKIADLEELSGEEIDVINPMVSPSGDYLIFMNKRDLSLWSLRLTEESPEDEDEEEGEENTDAI